MQAALFRTFGGPEVLELAELPIPRPGPGQVRIKVWAAGVNASDWKKRQGLLDSHLPQTLGYEAAGTIDELGAGVHDVTVGERVFGFCPDGAAQAQWAILSYYARLPAELSFEVAAALPAALETAARALRQLGAATGQTLFINGASGNIGAAALQLAVAQGVRVIGAASPAKHDLLRSLGALPVAYGPDLLQDIHNAAPAGVHLALDVAGNGILPQLIALTGSAQRVLTVADVAGAQQYGVRFSRGDDGRALDILSQIGDLVSSGRFALPAVQVFALKDVAQAHRVGEAGQATGKLIVAPWS